MTTIVLAEDHQMVRQGFRLLLAAQKDLQVVGEAGDGLEAARLVEEVMMLLLRLSRRRSYRVTTSPSRRRLSPS